MKRIMVVGAGSFQVPIINKCKEAGLYVIATDRDETAPGLILADQALIIDTNDRESTLAAAQKYGIEAIVTTSDYPVRTVSYVAEKMGLFGPTVDAASISTNKYRLREVLFANGIPGPRYVLLKDANEIERCRRLSFPVVIKPTDSSASRGVSKVESFEDLYQKYSEALSFSKNNEVLVEEFIEGNEFSIEVLIQNKQYYIVTITEKTTSGEPYFVEERHIVPAGISNLEYTEIKDMVIRTLQAIGLDNSAAHVEIKLTKQGPRVIEVGPRLGGDYITSDIVPLATGVDMLENAIRIALGRPVDVIPKCSRNSAVQFITPFNTEKFENRYAKFKQDARVVAISFEGEKKGEVLRNSFDRSGHYICVCENRRELDELILIS